MSLVSHDGRALTGPVDASCDLIVVGSGPAGSMVADRASAAGLRVIVLEEGDHHAPQSFAPDAWTAMARTYRGMGGTLTRGRQPIPVVQGRAVGGGSVINGAISWRLPHDVWSSWVTADPGLAEHLPWEHVEAETDAIVTRLGITPTPTHLAGNNNRLLAAGAEALGLAHRPISRNAPDCRGSGLCLSGCPTGAKRSMDRSLLADAVGRGTSVWSAVHVDRVLHEHGRATGVSATARGGGRVTVRAARGVVLAASVVQSPLILRRSGLVHGDPGAGFQTHPGSGLLARFPDAVRCWEGATQGHEVIGLRETGLKFEALGLDRGVLGSRLPGLGRALSTELDRMDHYTSWAVALKSKGVGRVVPARWPWEARAGQVVFDPTADDLRNLARGIAWLGRMALAAGAVEVLPGIVGFDARVTDARRLDVLEARPPRDARAYTMVATHLFGTCRASTDPARGVVRGDLRHHTTDGLWVVDASVFPTNTGVNPQTSILAVAAVASRGITGGA